MLLLVRQKTIRLHSTQAAFRWSQTLYRGFVGGRGSGKSWVGAYDLLRRAKPGRTYLVGSPTSILMADTTFPTFKAIAQDLLAVGSIKLSPYPNIQLANGAMIRFRTMEDPERARGPNLSGVWLDEASLMAKETYDICIASLREEGEQGWLAATFTPKGLTHWTYDVFATGKPNTEIFRSRTSDNPFLPADFEQTLAEQYAGRQALQELGGEFLDLEGAEWPAEYLGPHVFFDDWPQDLVCKVMSLDPSKGKKDKSGDYSAFVMLGVDSKGVLWADADMDNTRPVQPLESRPDTTSILEDGLAILRTWKPQAFVVETIGFQEWVARVFQDAAAKRNLTLPLYGFQTTDPKIGRIRTLGPYLAQRRLRIRNTKGGKMLAQQLRDFPVGTHDDGPDALKFAELMADYLLNGSSQVNQQVQLLRA
jgi:phage terminase large subunit-like protein